MIKKCAGFDMNFLCYDPAYENHQYINAIQEMMDLRYARGIQKEKDIDQICSVCRGAEAGRLRQRARTAFARGRK